MYSIMNNNNINNGLITKIWGPDAWMFLHSVTFGYPMEPSTEQKKVYKQFFIDLGDVLPCRYCRESYKKFIMEPETELNDVVMENRKSLCKWFFNIHQRVNKKLDVDYGITFEQVESRYESYRAKCGHNNAKGCIMPLDEKAKSFAVAKYKDAPIIPIILAKKFESFARSRGITDSDVRFLYCCNDDKDVIKKARDMSCNEWCLRNNECRDIIENMRINGIHSLEEDGPFKGLPSVPELKLIMRLSSNLGINELEEVSKKIQNNKRKIYRLKP